MGSYAAPFFINLFSYFYESKWMNELKTDESKWMNQLKRNDLIKVRKLWNIFTLENLILIMIDNYPDIIIHVRLCVLHTNLIKCKTLKRSVK